MFGVPFFSSSLELGCCFLFTSSEMLVPFGQILRDITPLVRASRPPRPEPLSGTGLHLKTQLDTALHTRQICYAKSSWNHDYQHNRLWLSPHGKGVPLQSPS